MNDTKNTFLRFDATELDEPSLKIVLQELGETEESRMKGLWILREELKSCTDIEPCLDESFLLAFLRVAKFDTTKALCRIKNFYQHQEKLVDGFKKISMSYHKARSLKHIFVSPYRLKNNSLLVMASGGIDYSVYSFEERFYLESLAISLFLENQVSQMCGFNLIIDYSGFNFRGLREHTPWKLKWFLDSALNKLPIRFKSFHVVNAPSLFSSLYSMGYPFLPKKIQERVFIHPNDNWKSLHAHFPADILPEKYGGNLNDSSMLNFIEYFGLENLEEKFHKKLEYGLKKTKHRRLALKVLH
ncbi:retinaldehyde-binding protein 1-like [Argiope bruennichi]|uniref:retinaldehyde-binding protein 1-like n=1 Tax=Argiope bruennichi TaxID=94029 RepID=UPI0024949615|nr:retinaldehyde-binding protein 1-like [Argiope bruennichi]